MHYFKPVSPVGWVSRRDDFDKKPITFHPRRNPPPEILLQTTHFSPRCRENLIYNMGAAQKRLKALS
jgi:hypothetical protein